MNRKAVEFRIILACASIVHAAVVMGVWLLYCETGASLTQGLVILSLAALVFIAVSEAFPAIDRLEPGASGIAQSARNVSDMARSTRDTIRKMYDDVACLKTE